MSNHQQLLIGSTRALYIESPPKGHLLWWFEIRDPRTDPPLVLAIRHIQVPLRGNRHFEDWIMSNMLETDHIDIPRIWGAIQAVQDEFSEQS